MEFAIFFTLLLAGASALPTDELGINSGQERIITNNIERAIEQLSQSIQEAGLDPLSIDFYKFERVTFIGSCLIWMENLLFTGASNIVIDHLNFSVIASRLRINLVLPRISLRVRSAGIEMKVLSRKASAELGGSVEILAPRIIGDLRFNIGIISGISVSTAVMQFELKGIESNLSVRVLDKDLSDGTNEWLGETIPNYLEENKNAINAWLSDITVTLLNRVL